MRRTGSPSDFPVAPRLLPAATRRHLRRLHGYANQVGRLGDDPGPGGGAFDRFERELRAVHAGAPASHPILAALAPTIAACRLPVEPLARLVEGRRTDRVVLRYRSFDQVVAHCRLSANPIGELVLHVFGCATAERVELSDRVCTALQVIGHLRGRRRGLRPGRGVPAAGGHGPVRGAGGRTRPRDGVRERTGPAPGWTPARR
ncbi:hypothetical protein GCM10010170_001040 [Dactylosporangium salmoneum]|uniref:Uncharacterized protein n=1 Tax=Dactylosporangium salmoneum TaxID=53361 RepID=A0ABP5SAY9_9ACTN